MTANKRRKNKTRAIMEAAGTNYVRAARIAGSVPSKDPVNLSWSPGTVTLNRTPSKVYDEFSDSSFPHLLIAGMSASKPELLLRDMLDQIGRNNSTQDVRFSIIEPALALKGYENSPHTERYVDSWTAGNFVANAASLLGEVVAEMEQRYEVFVNHEGSPKNLRMARSIALRESLANGTPVADHELYLPYKLVVIHESNALFVESSNPDERKDQRHAAIAVHELARKARAAGIYLVFSSRYPVHVSVPSPIRNGMRTIGLSVSSEQASRLVVDDGSCFGLPKTKGILKVSNSIGSITLTTTFDRNSGYLPDSVGLDANEAPKA